MGKYVSMSGLDLSFMKTSPKVRSKKPRKKKERDCRSDLPFPMIMADIKPFVSPIDGTEISSRSSLKAHELKHDVRQCGDFKPGEIVAKEKKRIAKSLEQAKGAESKWI